jgi:ketosteroid isomerase-like protein
MSEQQVEIVRKCWAGLEEDPPNLRLEYFDEEVELRNPPEFPLQGPFHGHDGLRTWAAEVWEVITGLHHEIEEIIEAPDGETIVTVQRTQGQMRHPELPANLRWATVWRFRDGKVVRGEGYLDRAQALEAAGLTEQSPG